MTVAIVMSALGLAGAWCLYVGPVYQASLELRAQELARERIAAFTREVKQPAKVSPWWWLLPPLRWYLERQRSRAFRDEYFKKLTVEEHEALHAYMHKASGWLLVAGGGLLLAIKETHAFCKDRHFPIFVFVTVAIAGALLGVLWTINRIRASEKRLAARRAAEQPNEALNED